MPLDTDKLERLRKELGLTQAEAARRAKLPGRAYWNDIVSGRRANVTLAVLDNLAAALHCSPSRPAPPERRVHVRPNARVRPDLVAPSSVPGIGIRLTTSADVLL